MGEWSERVIRARIRPSAELDGRQDRAHHRDRAGEVQDRDDESRLQHPPAGSARAGGGRARLSALTGGVRAASCKRIARSPSKPQNGPDRGTHPGASAATTRPAKAKSLKSDIFSRFPCDFWPLEKFLEFIGS